MGAKVRRPLSGELVVRTALDLADEAGIAGVTMRSIADRLDTYPASLYWHVGNRNEILAQVLQLVMTEMELPAPGSLRWDEWLASAAREYRRVLHAHPKTAVLALYPLLTAPDFVESMLAVLQRGGFRGASLAYAFNAFSGSVAGWVAIELSAGGGEDDQAWRSEFEARVRGISATEYPTIASNLPVLADEAFTLRWHGGADKPLDESFDAALHVWVSGLRSLLRSSRQP